MCYSLSGREQNLIQNFKKEHRHTCHYCGKEIVANSDLTVDHLVPVSRGGKTVNENLAICCVKCNQEKANMNENEFKIYLAKKEVVINNSNTETLNNTKQIINTYEVIINTYDNLCKEIAEQNEMKIELENTIEREVYNCAEGYNLCRDLKNTLKKITELRKERDKMLMVYNHAKCEIQVLRNIAKKMFNNSIKEIKDEVLNVKNIA